MECKSFKVEFASIGTRGLMNTWLENFIEQTDLNRYPVVLRTEGGIGFKVGNDTISNFVSHPVHYEESREMKPITLNWIPSTNEFEGSWFGWDVIKKCPTYCGYELYTPKAVIWNGIAYPLNFLRFENRMIADIPIGTFEIKYSEWGINEIVTIPEPVEGILEFDTPEQAGWKDYLYINPRRVVGGDQSGNVFMLTKNMTYPLIIDPDYSGDTSDGTMYSNDVATFASARNTSDTLDTAGANLYVGMNKTSSADWWVYRSAAKFNTSGIPDADTISQVNMKLTCTNDSSTTDFNVVIRKYNWSASDPLGSGNRETVFDGILAATSDTNIWRSTSGMSLNTQYASGDLTTSWVNVTGNTYYGLISSRDVSNTTPTGPEQISLASQNHATSAYRPVLTVAHSGSSAQNSNFFMF